MRSLLAVGIVAVLCASVPSRAGDERAAAAAAYQCRDYGTAHGA